MDCRHHEFVDQQGVAERVQRYLKASMNVCLVGPPGIGKTTLIQGLVGADRLETVTATEMTPADLIGRWTIEKDQTVWQDGSLTRAARQGLTFYLDEMVGIPRDCARILHSVLDHRREVGLTACSQTVPVHPDFRFVASTNYAETELSRAFRDRFVFVPMQRLDDDAERQFLLQSAAMDPSMTDEVDYLLRVARIARQVVRDHVTTRQLVTAVEAIRSGVARDHAAFECMLTPAIGCSIHGQSTMRAILAALQAHEIELGSGWPALHEDVAEHGGELAWADDAEVW